MHSLSYLLGATRLEEDWSPATAALTHTAEERLRGALFSAASSSSLADLLLRRIKQPFEEMCIAALRSDPTCKPRCSWIGAGGEGLLGSGQVGGICLGTMALSMKSRCKVTDVIT